MKVALEPKPRSRLIKGRSIRRRAAGMMRENPALRAPAAARVQVADVGDEEFP
jgi:hypothetical protein